MAVDGANNSMVILIGDYDGCGGCWLVSVGCQCGRLSI
jgi:hypothetical protein